MTELTEFRRDLEEIKKLVRNNENRIIELATKLDPTLEGLERVQRVVTGNGASVGLRTRIALLEQAFKERAQRDVSKRAWNWGLAAGVILLILDRAVLHLSAM